MLDRLVEHGLVLADPTSRGYMYRLNRDHLLTPAVLAADSDRYELLARLTVPVEAVTPSRVYASVFGSVARTTATRTAASSCSCSPTLASPGAELGVTVLAGIAADEAGRHSRAVSLSKGRSRPTRPELVEGPHAS